MGDPRQNNGVSAVFATAKEAVARVANDLRHQYGEGLTREQWLKLVSVFRAGTVPRRRAGRRPKPQVTASYLDWKTGMRGVALFRKHIPGWEKHNRYHRIGEQKELIDAIRSRYRRERGSAA
jgi:RecB family exonuclease